nr:MAG TPA: hypothetical protein [Caudoviricetes sp.]
MQLDIQKRKADNFFPNPALFLPDLCPYYIYNSSVK